MVDKAVCCCCFPSHPTNLSSGDPRHPNYSEDVACRYVMRKGNAVVPHTHPSAFGAFCVFTAAIRVELLGEILQNNASLFLNWRYWLGSEGGLCSKDSHQMTPQLHKFRRNRLPWGVAGNEEGTNLIKVFIAEIPGLQNWPLRRKRKTSSH